MRIYQYAKGLGSVAYTPDGTLFVLTREGSSVAEELWAHPHAGLERIEVARSVARKKLAGWLDASSDGRWLVVHGQHNPVLFRIGALAPDPNPAKGKRTLLSGWSESAFPTLYFHGLTCFTGDSSYWVGRTGEGHIPRGDSLRYWQLSDLTHRVGNTESAIKKAHVASAPGARHVVVVGWPDKRNPHSLWRVEPAAPDAPPELIGTLEHCDYLSIGSDGRFYASCNRKVRVYSPLGPGRLQLDLTFNLKKHALAPRVKLCADSRLFVACCAGSKLVYGGNTVTGAMLGPWDWKIGPVIIDVAISPDGLTAAAAGSDARAVVWDLDQ